MCWWDYTQSINRSFVYKAKKGRHVRIPNIPYDVCFCFVILLLLLLSFINVEWSKKIGISRSVSCINNDLLRPFCSYKQIMKSKNKIQCLTFNINKNNVDHLVSNMLNIEKHDLSIEDFYVYDVILKWKE
jgi:hypothetical protein